MNLNNLTPEEYRERYEALQAAARERAAIAQKITSKPVQLGTIRLRESIPVGCYVTLRLKRHDVLRITNPDGTPGAALFMWNADEPSERFNAGDTVKLQWTTNLAAGRVLFSDMGRVMFSIITDSGAGHDCIIGPNSPSQVKTGANGRDNLRLAAAKFGLTKRDLGPSISLFSMLKAGADGRLTLAPTTPNSAIDLRAEQNLLVALSNTPHALSTSTEATGVIEIEIGHAPPASDDLCRSFTEEAARGFMNTDVEFV